MLGEGSKSAAQRTIVFVKQVKPDIRADCVRQMQLLTTEQSTELGRQLYTASKSRLGCRRLQAMGVRS